MPEGYGGQRSDRQIPKWVLPTHRRCPDDAVERGGVDPLLPPAGANPR